MCNKRASRMNGKGRACEREVKSKPKPAWDVRKVSVQARKNKRGEPWRKDMVAANTRANWEEEETMTKAKGTQVAG
ncbi:hypothetical protein R1flu_000840 [Riccia fluitans]|uniref:Uncharacterized protein n=1 Tax=Riccia fluitans TaxID=41844 RepID=A0ABD1Y1M1_9MARC